MRNFRVIAAFVVAVLVLAACSSSGGGPRAEHQPALKPIRLQLQWFPQAQFAGYFAALDKGYYARRGLRRHDPAGRGRDRARRPSSPAARPSSASAGCRACSPRASRAPTCVVIGQIFQRSPTLQVSFKDKNITKPEDLQGQEGRQLGLRQRVRAVRRDAQGRHRPGQGVRRHHRRPAVRHGRLRRRRDRCRPGDDLQRVRPGPRDQEPGDRQAVHARRPQRHLVGAVRHLDAPGRDLRLRGVAQAGRQRGHRGQVPEGVVQGLDLLPRQPGGVRGHRAQARRQAAQGPPDVAAQRGQRDHLAGPERDRDHRQGRLRPDGPGGARRQDPDQAGRPARRGATTSPRRRSPRSGRAPTPRARPGRSRRSPSPRAASSRPTPLDIVPWHEGRPARAGLRRSGARATTRTRAAGCRTMGR